MLKQLIPMVACVALGGSAFAQTVTTPKTEPARPHMRVERLMKSIGCGSYLGVMPADVTEEKAKEMGMSDAYGALLEEVTEGTPAKEAGLQKGDVIITWNGARVESAAQLRRLVGETPAGRTVRIGYMRAGSRLEAEAKIAQRPMPDGRMFSAFGDSNVMKRFQVFSDSNMIKRFQVFGDSMKRFNLGPMIEQFRANPEAWSKDGNIFFMSNRGGRMGTSLQNLTPQLAKYFGLGDRTGALVGSVSENSAAAEAGLQAGDVLVDIDGQKVGSPMEAAKIISSKPEGDVTVKVIRDKQERTFTVKLKGKAMELPSGSNMDFNGLFAPFEGGFEGLEGLEELEMIPNENGSLGESDLGSLIPPDAPRVRRFKLRALPPSQAPMAVIPFEGMLPPTPPTPPAPPAVSPEEPSELGL